MLYTIRFNIAPIARVKKSGADLGKRIAIGLWKILKLKGMYISTVLATKDEIREAKEYDGLFHVVRIVCVENRNQGCEVCQEQCTVDLD